MILLVISTFLSFITLIFFWLTLDLVTGILPALLILCISYLIFTRRWTAKIQKCIENAIAEIQKGRAGSGIELLRIVKKRYALWQFSVARTIDSQIGIVYFMLKDFKKAKPLLEKSFIKQWNARVALALIAFLKKEYKKMDEIFEKTAKYSPKQGLLWSTWAYCHWKIGNSEKAINILARGQEKLGNLDKYLNINLTNLKNNKKMKMSGYGQEWLQFQLEQPQAMKVKIKR